MVAHVLRLRAALLVGVLRGDRVRAARFVLGFLVLAAATTAGCWGVLTLGDAPVRVAHTVLVLGGSAIALGFAVGPLVAGATDPLDPRRFAVFGVERRPLAAALLLASVVSVPTLVVSALAVCGAIAWTAQGAPWPLAALGAAAHVITCLLLARVGMALGALVLRERRTRELSSLFALAVIVVVIPVGVFLASLHWGGRVPSQLETAASVLGATPLGAAWALPAGAAHADAAMAWSGGLVSLATVALLVVAWFALVGRLLTTAEHPASVRERGGLGWFAVAPGTPGGAIAARSLVYWFRDSRYIVNMLIIPIAALLTVVPLMVAGVSPEIVVLVPVPIMALFFGWLPHNDIAYDSTAVWMHVAGAVRGISDRVGRLVPIVLVALPILAVLVPVSVALHGRWALLPAYVGVCAALFLAGLGLSSIASTLSPYAVSRPGDSAFQQPQRSGAGGVIAQAIVLFGTIVVSAPTLWFGWRAITGELFLVTETFWTGIGTGLGVLAIGLALGSVLFDRRGMRIMQFAETA